VLFIPSALRLVEDDYVLMWWFVRRTSQTLLEEVVDVLDASADFETNVPEVTSFARRTLTVSLIAS